MLCLQSAAFDGMTPVDSAKLLGNNGLQENAILTRDCIASYMVFAYTAGRQ